MTKLLAARPALLLLVLLLLAPAPPLRAQAPLDTARVRLVRIAGSLPEARGAVVVLPRGYAAGARRYPVLYLLHGLWGGHRDWLDRTDLLRYTADLALIVVLPDAGDSWYANSVTRPADRFEDYVGRDVVAYVDRSFRTLPFREARYVAGLSMGGYGAYKLALRNPGAFSVVGSFSGAFGVVQDTVYPGIREAMGPPGGEGRRAGDVLALLRDARLPASTYFYLDVGTGDQLIGASRQVAARLHEQGLPYQYHEVRGEHAWEYWNRRLPVLLEIIRERMRELS